MKEQLKKSEQITQSLSLVYDYDQPMTKMAEFESVFRDALGDIEVIKFDSNYQKFLKSNNKIVKNHYKTKHSEKAIDRMKKIKVNENYTSLNEDTHLFFAYTKTVP